MSGVIVKRVGIFVDAGYLFAQGATAITGQKQTRKELTLDVSAVVGLLKSVLVTRCASDLLRIFWYDGVAKSGNLSMEQLSLAEADNVKPRLGQINDFGQQKGVDSLIVTDLVELSRNGSIGDALLLSGDEDVRIGVEIAQNYGVRVHLIGIDTGKGSQAKSLRMAADTLNEWSATEVKKFLNHTISMKDTVSKTLNINEKAKRTESSVVDGGAGCDEVLDKVLTGLRASQRLSQLSGLGDQDPLPSDIDSELLKTAAAHLGRMLESSEKRRLRTQLKLKVRINQ